MLRFILGARLLGSVGRGKIEKLEVRQVLTDSRKDDLLSKRNRMCFGQIKPMSESYLILNPQGKSSTTLIQLWDLI